MPERTLVERLWEGGDPAARVARLALGPLSALYGGVVRLRGALYDRGVLATHEPAVPAISIGNLSVGGTGKTPVAAWVAGELRRAGARPAIVLRGYGGDEPLVHRLLNPDVPVVTAGGDRVGGVRRARAEGADVVVLDDAFQHRRIRRSADVVLVSADRWRGRPRLLPAGGWREPLSALRRASLLVVTRKAAAAEAAEAIVERLRAVAPAVPVAVAHLAPSGLRGVDGGADRPLEALRGRRVLAIAAIGDPEAFRRQLEAAGAEVTGAWYPDHHAYSAGDAAALARRAGAADWVVCTLKDAVKLGPLWPRAASPLWYVSQQVRLERGAAAMSSTLQAVLRDRPQSHSHTVG